jgi:hypothetical protein
MLVPLESRLVASFGWCAPWAHWVHITLRFTTSTTVRVISYSMSDSVREMCNKVICMLLTSIHRNTSYFRSLSEPS